MRLSFFFVKTIKQNSIHFQHTFQIQSQVHDINSMFKKSKMKIVSSFNALFPELLLHEKEKKIFNFFGRACLQ